MIQLTVKPVTPIRWVEPPRRSWHKRVIAKLLRLPKPVPIPVYGPGVRAVRFDTIENGVKRSTYLPHATIERA